MNTAIIAFTEKGFCLGEKLGALLDCSAERLSSTGLSLHSWTEQAFLKYDNIIFIGAVGIAVRGITPFIVSKAQDPAVVVIDELGRYAIPILSGHLGGANELARRIEKLISAEAVITTATDINNIFSVDDWARVNDMTVLNPEKIKSVSSALLEGRKVFYSSDIDIDGKAPENVISSSSKADFRVTYKRRCDDALVLVPRVLVVGIGCRKDIDSESIEKQFMAVMEENNLLTEAVCEVHTIDLKLNEEGLKDFCRSHDYPLEAYSTEELNDIDGEFSSSDFVRNTVGVDCVCERSAVIDGGTLIVRKQADHGVTIAVALKNRTLTWR